MAGTIRAAGVVVGLLTENTSPMLTQAIRLLRSIRWFGGELAPARIVVCGVGPLETTAQETLEALGAEVRTVTRFHPANPTANRLQLLAELLDAPQDLLFILDCDTIVVRDPLPYLTGDAFQAKVAPTPTVSDEVFERLFNHFGMPKPPRSRIAPFSNAPMIPYFNAGVIAIPRALARRLEPVWRKYNQALADHPELVAPCQRHMHQASLALALAETGLPCVDLPAEMNFQINATQVTPPPGYPETDPVIIHYHHLATEDGFLLPTPYPAAQARIESFHRRMLAEGFTPAPAATSEREARPVVILGMHRSGTSLVGQLLSELGLYAGQPHELAVADIFNPTGYWEHKDIVTLDAEILDRLGAGWAEVVNADVTRLSEDERLAYVARARRVVTRSLLGHGPFLVKDPRMSLLFPLWREALQNPVAVLVWRDPMAVARSLATRDKRPILASLAVWEHYNRTLLRDTAGIPRLLVSYDDLMAEPMRVIAELQRALTAMGIEGLHLPTAERMRQIVNDDFNRSGRGSVDETLLDAGQRALLAGLRSGAVLHEAIPPTSPRTFALLTQFDELEARKLRMAREVDDLDQLLRAVFASRSWRLGYRLTSLLRFFRRAALPSAMERWRALKRNRPV